MELWRACCLTGEFVDILAAHEVIILSWLVAHVNSTQAWPFREGFLERYAYAQEGTRYASMAREEQGTRNTRESKALRRCEE